MVVPLNQNLLIIVHVNSLSDSLSVSRTVCSRDEEKVKEEGTVGGRDDDHDGRLWFSPSVLEVKYDWLVHSWVDMPSLQLQPVNSMCTDWAEWRVKAVVTATWEMSMVGWPGRGPFFRRIWPAGWPASHVFGFPHPFWEYIIGIGILFDIFSLSWVVFSQL